MDDCDKARRTKTSPTNLAPPSVEKKLLQEAETKSAETRLQLAPKAKANGLTPKVRLVTFALVMQKTSNNADAACATVLSTTRKTAIIPTPSA